MCNSWDDAEDDLAEKVKEGDIDTSSLGLLSKDQARSNVVQEIIQAERDYVKHLHDVLQVNSPLVHSHSSTTSILSTVLNIIGLCKLWIVRV